ncbi:hypothetical protein GCM10027594_06970 [Hymenobacter agri]|uniref:Carrier domain-containing protein n=1 Tax=Hymenobacter jeollabukensis TaxID=2025313 RepID=A0A5R8WIR3_9BACT|nr:phosphopantetheine-binding protein [Hymenobacter jeollabukensis]TLM88476.1 hypothetical protein FDY95_24245 [Hymenobacter jeollabukensis]
MHTPDSLRPELLSLTMTGRSTPLAPRRTVRRRIARALRHVLVGHRRWQAGLRLTEDLHLSSLDRQELALDLETEFGLDLPNAEVAALATLGDVVACVRRHLPRAA